MYMYVFMCVQNAYRKHLALSPGSPLFTFDSLKIIARKNSNFRYFVQFSMSQRLNDCARQEPGNEAS